MRRGSVPSVPAVPLSPLHRSKGSSRCAIKADLRKAYDSVDWNFILMCLLTAGCPLQFVQWIRECITNSRFTIALNGSLVGYFQGGKGLRQGDPISVFVCDCYGGVYSIIAKESS